MTCKHCSATFDEPDWIEVCKECGEPEAYEVSCGDEGLTVCDACRCIEGGYKLAPFCPDCEERIELEAHNVLPPR